MRCAVESPTGVQLLPMAPGDACVGVALLEPQDVPPSALTLTVEQGGAVSFAIVSCWVVAWTTRQIIEVLRAGDRPDV